MGFTYAKNTETALGNPVLERVFAKICVPYIAKETKDCFEKEANHERNED